MRSTITAWYHKKYGVEAPEQIEDRTRLMKELGITETSLIKKPNETPRKQNSTVKELIQACEMDRIPELTRSVSADNNLDIECTKNQSDLETDSTTARHKNLQGGQMARSSVNLLCTPKIRSPIEKSAKENPNRIQSPQTARAEMKKTLNGDKSNREKTVIIKECLVSPRVAKIEARGGERLLNKPKILETTAAEGSTKSEVPASKAHLQQKLQERRRQWR
ncbi:uncharacterized protein LOC117780231 isoform X2 [Drosophila innubila]|nr:uncharacterized protein LOC117780231 isoform X2 [Drosophila innubila]